MPLAEGLISLIVKRGLEKRRADLQIIGRDVAKLEKIEAPFPRISYDDAVKNLQEGHANGKLESKFEWGGAPCSPHPPLFSTQLHTPLMISRYPRQEKALYMQPHPRRPELALCIDLFSPDRYRQ